MDEIKPVAWRARFKNAPELGDWFSAEPIDGDLNETEPLYDQQAIDTLRAEIEENEGVIRVWRGRTERAEAEVESAWTQANRAAAKVRAWESTMVFRGLPRSIHPVDDWGPGGDGYVEIPALTPEKLTCILDRLAAAEAEAEALRKDAERYRWLRDPKRLEEGSAEDAADKDALYIGTASHVFWGLSGDLADANIDAAMKATE